MVQKSMRYLPSEVSNHYFSHTQAPFAHAELVDRKAAKRFNKP